jgi:RND family efflux transporter MFP subunit
VNEWLRRWLPLPILGVGALGAWGLAQGRPEPTGSAANAPAPLVAVVEVQRRSERASVRTHGTVEARTEIDLVAEIAGRVAVVSPALATGAFFETGDVLVELEGGDAELALERAEAAVLRAQSELGLADARLARHRTLAQSEIASAARLEESEHARRMAAAQLREARATREQARRDLDRTRIRAPFAGRVRSKQVDQGQFVARGTPLARIYAVDSAEVRLPIPTSELVHLDVPIAGRSPNESTSGSRAFLRARFAGRVSEWEARIVRAEGEIEASSRMIHVVARVDDPYGRRSRGTRPPLTVGLFVEAEILGRTLDEVFVLPRSALRPPDEVLVVDSDERLRASRVEVLRVAHDRILVGAGLDSGARVVVSALGAVEGTVVRAAGGEAGTAIPRVVGIAP